MAKAGSNNTAEDIAGFIIIARKIQDHPFWNKKPFSEFHALVWLIMNARYSDKPKTEYVGNKLMTWTRGQLPASLRFMESAFGWTKSKVERWLKFLIDSGTVKRVETQSGTLLEIINYEKYQNPRRKTGQQSGHGTGQGNPLPDRDSDEQRDSNEDSGDTNGWENRETVTGQQRDKTVNKGVLPVVTNEENNVSVEEKNTIPLTPIFFNKKEEEQYTEAQRDFFIKFNKLIDLDYRSIRKLEKQFTLSEFTPVFEAFGEEIITKMLKAMDNNPSLSKNNKSAVVAFGKYLKNEKDPSLRKLIDRKRAEYEYNLKRRGDPKYNESNYDFNLSLSPAERAGHELLEKIYGKEYMNSLNSG